MYERDGVEEGTDRASVISKFTKAANHLQGMRDWVDLVHPKFKQSFDEKSPLTLVNEFST